MGHDDFQVRVTHEHVPRQHIHHGASSLRRIFVHRQRCGSNDSLRIRRGAVRVDDDDGIPLVQDFHQRIQRLVAQVLPPAVGRQLYAVRTQGIKHVNGFPDGGVHIRQRQGSTEPEPAGIILFHLCRNLVYAADALGTFLRITVIRLRCGHRQHGGADACAVHKGDVPLRSPYG